MNMLCIQDFEEYAEKHLDDKTWRFYSQGVEREETLRQNLLCFTRYRLIPRMLRNSPSRDLTTTVLGEQLSLPLGIAPAGYQKMAHPEGELATAAAAADMGIAYTLSQLATTPLEEVADVVKGATPLWFQVYLFKERKYTMEMIRKAEANGYKALVITVDTPVKGLQIRSWRNPLKPPPGIMPVNIIEAVKKINPNFDGWELTYFNYFENAVTWDDVAAIINFTRLPVVLKGILTAEDAIKASSVGAAAVWVSNHGGRQLDCVSTGLDALPSISKALAGTGCEVYVDGGVRWGTDVLKAIALGARCVFIGRPALYGLAHSGKDGVKKVIEILKSELDRAMHLTGCKDIRDIGPHLIQREFMGRL